MLKQTSVNIIVVLLASLCFSSTLSTYWGYHHRPYKGYYGWAPPVVGHYKSAAYVAPAGPVYAKGYPAVVPKSAHYVVGGKGAVVAPVKGFVAPSPSVLGKGYVAAAAPVAVKGVVAAAPVVPVVPTKGVWAAPTKGFLGHAKGVVAAAPIVAPAVGKGFVAPKGFVGPAAKGFVAPAAKGFVAPVAAKGYVAPVATKGFVAPVATKGFVAPFAGKGFVAAPVAKGFVAPAHVKGIAPAAFVDPIVPAVKAAPVLGKGGFPYPASVKGPVLADKGVLAVPASYPYSVKAKGVAVAAAPVVKGYAGPVEEGHVVYDSKPVEPIVPAPVEALPAPAPVLDAPEVRRVPRDVGGYQTVRPLAELVRELSDRS